MLTSSQGQAQGPQLGWVGLVEVRALLADGRVGEVVDAFPNLITDAGLDLLAGGLLDGRSTALRFLAVGTGSSPAAAGQTALVAETARFALDTPTRVGVGKTRSRAYLTDAQAVGSIRELGWFAGASATSTAGSGVLVARVLYDHTKGGGESLVIDRTDTILRGATA